MLRSRFEIGTASQGSILFGSKGSSTGVGGFSFFTTYVYVFDRLLADEFRVISRSDICNVGIIRVACLLTLRPAVSPTLSMLVFFVTN